MNRPNALDIESSSDIEIEEQKSLLSENGTNSDEIRQQSTQSGTATSSTSTSTSTGTTGTNNTELIKLAFGAGGIYAAFLYYGSLQEDVFRYVAADGTKFTHAWFLQFIEALANVIIGYIGMILTGPTKNIPLKMFAISGIAQVCAKTSTSLALANGLSFPVATLAKSAKMAPVMAGSLVLGGASYDIREYIQVLAIIGGTAIVNFGGGHKSSTKDSNSSILGLLYIVSSLTFDGITAGFQKKLQVETAKVNCKPKPYDFMFWTNLFMMITAVFVALLNGEIFSGTIFCINNSTILYQIIQFAICSAIGQSFIFYTLANFDPLLLSTVTTTRKIFSVLLSIFFKGHSLSTTAWFGVILACSGIASELTATKHNNKKVKARV